MIPPYLIHGRLKALSNFYQSSKFDDNRENDFHNLCQTHSEPQPSNPA